MFILFQTITQRIMFSHILLTKPIPTPELRIDEIIIIPPRKKLHMIQIQVNIRKRAIIT